MTFYLIGQVAARIPHRAIAQAVNLIIFIERTGSGRELTAVRRVLGVSGVGYDMVDASAEASVHRRAE